MTGKPLANLSLSELIAAAKAGQLASTMLSLVQPGAPPAPGQGHAFAQDAPAGSPLAVELITTKELLALASKLSKSKNDFKQSTGRALEKALHGQLWAPDGHRDNTAYQIAAECIQAFPNLDPASVVQCFSAAISNAQAHGSDITPQKWAAMLVRVQNERQLRLNMVGQVAPLLSATGKALEAQAKLVTPQAQPVDPSASGAETPAPDPIDSLASVVHSLVILADGDYYLRTPSETHYTWKLKSQQALQVELARRFGVNNQTVITHEKGKPLPVTEWLLVYGANAHRIVYDYASPATTWEAESETLLVGFTATLPAAHPDAAVHSWLCALAGSMGDDESAISDLYDWIAACTRAYITKPSTALCIVGPPDAGKGVLVRALAATWGCHPVKLANAVERFNGSLLHSPVWHADERTPEGLTDDLFRTIVQERERLIEPKGREKVELRGCGRMVFTLNDPSDFQVGSIAGVDALQAVADRVSYFDCRGRKEALALTMAPLMLPDGDMDLPRIVRHLRWVQEMYKPRAQRFLGARADQSGAKAMMLSGIRAKMPALFDLLEQWTADPAAFEAGYALRAVAGSGGSFSSLTGGQEYPIVCWLRDDDARTGRDLPGELYVRCGELATRLGGYAKASEVEAALEPFRPAGAAERLPRDIKVGGRSIKYRALDSEKLASVLGEDLTERLKNHRTKLAQSLP